MGSIIKNEEYFVSDYIKVYPGQKLYKSGSSAGTSNCFYDENKNFISTVRLVGGVISVPTTNSISYMMTNGLLTDLDSIQITSGDTQSTYEAYIEPKIFIKNDNNIYEEFIKKEEDVDYKPREELIIPEGVIMPGNLTSDSSEVQCVFMTSKSLKNITNISIEDCLVVLRGINGYLDGSGGGIQLKGASNYTINTKIRNNAIIFSFVRTTKFNTTNNTPAVVYPISFKIILQ